MGITLIWWKAGFSFTQKLINTICSENPLFHHTRVWECQFSCILRDEMRWLHILIAFSLNNHSVDYFLWQDHCGEGFDMILSVVSFCTTTNQLQIGWERERERERERSLIRSTVWVYFNWRLKLRKNMRQIQGYWFTTSLN